MTHPIEISMTAERETPGTWRFRSDEPNAAVLLLYVRKDGFAGAPVPKKIVVTIVADDASVTNSTASDVAASITP
jgi:hypothetical protein